MSPVKIPDGLDATLALVRHGESRYIVEGRFQGRERGVLRGRLEWRLRGGHVHQHHLVEPVGLAESAQV